MIKKKNYFFTVQLLRSKNDFSEGKAPEKINLGNNCRPIIHTQISADVTPINLHKRIISNWPYTRTCDLQRCKPLKNLKLGVKKRLKKWVFLFSFFKLFK